MTWVVRRICVAWSVSDRTWAARPVRVAAQVGVCVVRRGHQAGRVVVAGG